MDAVATRSDDGRKLVLQVVNLGNAPKEVLLEVDRFRPSRPTAEATELAAPLDAVNTFAAPNTVVPQRTAWPHELAAGSGKTSRIFPPHSVTILRFE